MLPFEISSNSNIRFNRREEVLEAPCVCVSIHVACVRLLNHYRLSRLLQFPLRPGLHRINLIGRYVIRVLLFDLVPLRGYLVSADSCHLRGVSGQADVLAWILRESKLS